VSWLGAPYNLNISNAMINNLTSCGLYLWQVAAEEVIRGDEAGNPFKSVSFDVSRRKLNLYIGTSTSGSANFKCNRCYICRLKSSKNSLGISSVYCSMIWLM
jgi:hypothetical protein